MFQATSETVTVARLCPNYQMKDDMRDEVMALLHRSDVVFAQRVSRDYPIVWLTPAYLKAELGPKVFIWPNIYFDGYTPGVHYIYEAGWGKLQSPLEDYHLREIVEAFKLGRSVREATALLTSVEQVDGSDPFANSFESLQIRERDVDIGISDYVRQNVHARRSLYTPNHPYNFVLVEMARRLAQAAELAFDSNSAIARFSARLDRIYIPAAPWVARRYRLNFDRIQVYRGREIVGVRPGTVMLGKARSFWPADLIEQFYRIYDQVFAKEVA
jgi:hypothetical protein